MIATLIIVLAMATPKGGADIIRQPLAITTTTLLTIAEATIGALSVSIVFAMYSATYGLGLLTEHYPDTKAALIAFHAQTSLGFLPTGQITSFCTAMLPSFLALAKGRRDHLNQKSRARVAFTGLCAAALGWTIGNAILTCAIAAHQNIEGYETTAALVSAIVSATLSGYWLYRAAQYWSNRTGGGTRRFIRATISRIANGLKSTAYAPAAPPVKS